MVCVKELLSKILAGVVFTAIGAIIFLVFTLAAHYLPIYFDSILNWTLVVAVFWFTGFLVNEIYHEIKKSRKGGAK